MWNRVLAVFRAGFAAQWGSGAWPVAPLIVHGSLAAVLCGLVRSELPPFGYAVFALSVSAALIAVPLLGEFGALLRSDAASEWIEAQPVRRIELRIARTLLALLLIGALVLAALLPAALIAPPAIGWWTRAGLVLAGCAQASFLAAAILGIQSVLGERGERLLVLFQTVLMAAIVIGIVAGLRYVPRLSGFDDPTDGGALVRLFPPAWFAAVLFASARAVGAFWQWAAFLATVASIAILAFAALPPARRAQRAGVGLALALRPLRALASRTWVRTRERASFDLVFDALPLERDFVLRTYPMLGIPLAFLVAGARGLHGEERDALLAVLFFTPATYLPILLVHVPATASPGARWILDSAPLPRAALDNGAIKALAVRFLAPLYIALAAVALAFGGGDVVLRLALPAALLSLIVLRRLYPMCVEDLPLSVAAHELEAKLDWTGTLLTLGIGLTVLALVAFKYVESPLAGLAWSALLVAIEWRLDRSQRVRADVEEPHVVQRPT